MTLPSTCPLSFLHVHMVRLGCICLHKTVYLQVPNINLLARLILNVI